MKEEITISDGLGVIGVNGSKDEIHLSFLGKPIQMSWLAEEGTTMQYLLSCREEVEDYTSDLTYAILRYREQVKDPKFENLELSKLLTPLLKLLINGEYTLELKQVGHQFELVDPAHYDLKQGYSDYGGIVSLIKTQIQLNKKTLSEYKSKISEGKTPLAVVMGISGLSQFLVLDGHHKLYGYQSLNEPAYLIKIIRQPNDQFDVDRGVREIRKFTDSQEIIEKYKSIKKATNKS